MAVIIKLFQGDTDKEKSYQVPYLSGRALLELDMVKPAFEKSSQNETPTRDEIVDALEWFCNLFRNQFTVDDLVDGYPGGELMSDVFAAYLTAVNGTLSRLAEFPMKPAPTMMQSQQTK